MTIQINCFIRPSLSAFTVDYVYCDKCHRSPLNHYQNHVHNLAFQDASHGQVDQGNERVLLL